MGLLTNLIDERFKKSDEERQNKVTSYKAVLNDPNATGEAKEWALQQMLGEAKVPKQSHGLIGNIFGHLLGFNKGKTPGQGQQTSSQPNQPNQPTEGNDPQGGINAQPQPQSPAGPPQAKPQPQPPGTQTQARPQHMFKSDQELQDQNLDLYRKQRNIDVNAAVDQAKKTGELQNDQDELMYRRQLTRINNAMLPKEQGGQGMSMDEAIAFVTGKSLPRPTAQKSEVDKDPDSSTGWSRYLVNSDGTKVKTGEAPIPSSEKPTQDPAAVRSARWVQQHLNDPDPQVAAAAKQMNDRANAAIQNSGNQKLDAETLRFLAEKSLITGNDPSFGMGNAAAGNRVQFYRTQAQVARDQGDSPSALVADQAASKAARSAMPTIQKNYSQMKINEGNALKNFTLLQQLGQRMDNESIQSSIPLLNDWMRTGQVKLGGNKAVNDFLSALTTTMTEYAKVVTGQTSGAAVTDRARKETQDLLNRGLSTSAIRDWMETTAKPEMQNRRQSFEQEMSDLKEAAGGPQTAGGDQDQGKKIKVWTGIAGQPDGEIDADKWDDFKAKYPKAVKR